MIKINCKELASNLAEENKNRVSGKGININGNAPTLAIIQLGDNADDNSYKQAILKKCKATRIQGSVYNVNQSYEVTGLLRVMRNYSKIHGIIILGLSKVSKETLETISELLPSDKDVDGLSSSNAGKMFVYSKGFAPCTAEANLRILDSLPINLEGLKVAVVGRSVRVGKPVAMLMLQRNATVKICHSKTKNLRDELKDMDIVISAVGQQGIIQPDMLKEGVILIDNGINIDKTGHLCGDIAPECYEKSSYYTSVPGGVGVMTNNVLMEHVIQSWENEEMGE